MIHLTISEMLKYEEPVLASMTRGIMAVSDSKVLEIVAYPQINATCLFSLNITRWDLQFPFLCVFVLNLYWIWPHVSQYWQFHNY